jgi:hypothetical protein
MVQFMLKCEKTNYALPACLPTTMIVLQVASFDVFSQPLAVEAWNLQELQRWERLITYGRPGWMALWKVNAKKNKNPYSPEKLLLLAKRKLTAGIENSTWALTNAEDRLVRTIKLTLLSRRALIRIGYHSQEARSMVASCMGICTGVSRDLKLIRVQSVSEPILSEAAALLINQHKLWPSLIDTLIHGVQNGFVSSGTAGEIAAWIILSIAWDAACICKSQMTDVLTYTRSDVSLEDFLLALLGYVPEIGAEDTSEQDCFSQGSNGSVASMEKAAFVKELLARRVCFTHAAQVKSTKLSFGHLQDAACRMQLAVCAPGTHFIDAFTGLFPAYGAENQDLWSIQIQARNHARFDKNKSEVSLSKMSETAIEMAKSAGPGYPSVLPGLDIYLHIGHNLPKRKFCKFYVKCKVQRACLVLSTDSWLTLFEPAMRTVCGRKRDRAGNQIGAAELASLFATLIDLERQSLSQKGPWSMDHMPESVKKQPGCGQIPLNKQLENLQEVMCTGKVFQAPEGQGKSKARARQQQSNIKARARQQ